MRTNIPNSASQFKTRKMLVTHDVIDIDLDSGVFDAAEFLMDAREEFDLYFALPHGSDYTKGTYNTYFAAYGLPAPPERVISMDEIAMLTDRDGQSDFEAVLSYDENVRAMALESNAAVVYLDHGFQQYRAMYDIDAACLPKLQPCPASYFEAGVNVLELDYEAEARVLNFEKEWEKAASAGEVQALFSVLPSQDSLPVYRRNFAREKIADSMMTHFKLAVMDESERLEESRRLIRSQLAGSEASNDNLARVLDHIENCAYHAPKRW